MTVLAPSATLTGIPAEFLSVHAGYTADIVSGATESVKAGPLLSSTPDIVSTASITDIRHVVTGGVDLTRPHTKLGASYTYGTESDYRSNAFQVSAGTDFFQRNTEIEIAYARGFDEVCDVAQNADLAPTGRLALDESAGCFTDDDDRRENDLSLDNFHAAWTQAWTPVLATQLVFTGAIQHGFLSNPYRSVVIGPTGEFAQEHHPSDRARLALALRFKYYLRAIDLAVGFGVRGYRDTWEILSQAYELDASKDIFPWLRLDAHGRFYSQTGAVFWSDDYTGGEPITGPRGQYFSGDREVSPLKSLLGGGRLVTSWHGAPGERVVGLFLDFEAAGGLDVVKTILDDFTWAGQDPDDTLAFALAVSATASF
jgi:hypothetical protein